MGVPVLGELGVVKGVGASGDAGWPFVIGGGRGWAGEAGEEMSESEKGAEQGWRDEFARVGDAVYKNLYG